MKCELLRRTLKAPHKKSILHEEYERVLITSVNLRVLRVRKRAQIKQCGFLLLPKQCSL